VSAAAPSFDIDAGLRAQIESVGTILVGTRDAGLKPEITRGWGAHILLDCHTVELCVSLSAGAKTLANLRDHEEIAVTFHHTNSYKTVQLKGRFLESGELTPEDWERVQRHWLELTSQAKLTGIPLDIGSRVFTEDLVRIRFVVQEAFEQTPGPSAGSKL
jgi:hypothetical protein